MALVGSLSFIVLSDWMVHSSSMVCPLGWFTLLVWVVHRNGSLAFLGLLSAMVHSSCMRCLNGWFTH